MVVRTRNDKKQKSLSFTTQASRYLSKTLAKRKFPYIDMFDHEGPTLVTSPMELDQRVAYTQRILRGELLQKYKEILLECKKL